MNLSKFIVSGFLILLVIETISQPIVDKHNLYLIPGQGADARLFKNLDFDTSVFEVQNILWEIPYKGESLKAYALRLSKQIDTIKEFSIIGVSLGGMIATEINEILDPKKVILISSAKCANELPIQYRFQRTIPVYKIVPKGLIKQSTFIAQPLFEPDRKIEKETCVSMLKDKDPIFLKRTIEMIIKWDRRPYDSGTKIIHIHGNKDHTIPIKNVHYNFLIEGGSHMMILTRANEINKLLLTLLLN